MSEMHIDATFNYKKKSSFGYEQTEQYKEYRRRWNENPKNHTVEEFPIHLDLESTSACNLKCVMCFQSFNPPKQGFMSMELFKKIIDEGTENGLCSVKLMYRGEPLLHPNIAEMVQYAKDNGIIEVMFNTNANLLTEEMSRKLIAAGLDRIICSVDGFTAEVYNKIRVGGNFETVLNNIKNLQRIKKELGISRPIVRVQTVDTPINHNQLEEYVSFWSQIADDVAVEEMNDWHDKKLDQVIVCKDFDCPMPYQRLIVLYDGSVTICCGNIYGKLVAGNLNNQTVKEVWNGKVMQRLRECLKKGESHRIQICAECGYRATVIKDKKLSYEITPIKNLGNNAYYF